MLCHLIPFPEICGCRQQRPPPQSPPHLPHPPFLHPLRWRNYSYPSRTSPSVVSTVKLWNVLVVVMVVVVVAVVVAGTLSFVDDDEFRETR